MRQLVGQRFIEISVQRSVYQWHIQDPMSHTYLRSGLLVYFYRQQQAVIIQLAAFRPLTQCMMPVMNVC